MGLLPPSHALLLEVLNGLDPADPHLPELRVGRPGRSGSRYWLYGRQNRSFDGRRPFSQFDELRTAGLLRQLRKEDSGTYFAFTPAAFDYRDRLTQAPEPEAPKHRRPDAPPPEYTAACSGLEILRGLAVAAENALVALVEASSIKEFENDPGSDVIVIPANPWSWEPLDPTHVAELGSARAHADRWLVSARHVVATAAPEHLTEFDDRADVLRSIYIRGSEAEGPPARDHEQTTEAIRKALGRQLELIEHLPGAMEPAEDLVVPDTNALLHDPAIEDWVLGDRPACIALVQQVPAELDKKKIDGNPQVAAKAESLIRRFKEYSRRGDTFIGVKLAGSRTVREIPLTPDMRLMPQSLDAANADDRILASALHLGSLHLSSRVVLVSRDRNLQNKARFLSLPAVDVADL